ncbi:hypothetical protein CPB85DRAFT_1303894 [Mucidula mucida]|nr:hypothetical protein CPB85DRAFT_1303894 [Mucidula mucida]
MSSAEHDVNIDIDSTLSSLFFLRDGSEPITLPPCGRPNDSTPRNKSSTRRLLWVATSIAAICVREPTSEVFACSLSISRNSLEIYLAENHTVDPITIAYLDRLLTGLVDISEQHESFSEHVMGTLAVVLEFTLPKFLHSISRRDEDWDARMAEIEKMALSDEERAAFLELQERISYVYVTAGIELISGLGYLRALVFEAPDKAVIAEALKKIDFHSSVGRRSCDAEDLDPERIMIASIKTRLTDLDFSLTRYVARMLSVMVHVMRLVALAVSPTYKHLFTRTRPPIIHYLAPVQKSMLIDTGAALQFLADSLDVPLLLNDIFSSADDTVRQIDECPMLRSRCLASSYRCATRSAGRVLGYWYSKLMCAGCYATIARAYPKVLQDSQITTLVSLLTAPWIPPNLSNLDELVGFDFDRRVKAATLDVMKEDLVAIVRLRHSARKNKLKLFTNATEEANFVRRMKERVGKTVQSDSVV